MSGTSSRTIKLHLECCSPFAHDRPFAGKMLIGRQGDILKCEIWAVPLG